MVKNRHMYKFIKIKRDNIISNWYFVPEKEDDILEHWKKYAMPIIKDGIRDIINCHVKKIDKHPMNPYAVLVESLSNALNGGEVNIGIIEKSNIELVKVLEHRVNSFNNNRKILLTDGITETSYLSDDIIFEEKHMSSLTFPDEVNYNIDDVRYIRWDGGKHWYAKVGKLDICDENNNYKWNSKEEAIKAANKWFLRNQR